MKKLIALTIIVLFILKLNAQTTQEEYNYVIKGYKTQVETGLDMKKGYSLKELYSVTLTYGDVRKVTINGLYRDSDPSKPCALMIIYKKGDKSPEYICAPTSNSDKELDDAYKKALLGDTSYTDNDWRLQIIAYALSRVIF